MIENAMLFRILSYVKLQNATAAEKTMKEVTDQLSFLKSLSIEKGEREMIEI